MAFYEFDFRPRPVEMASVDQEKRNQETTGLNLNSDETPFKRLKCDQIGELSCDQCEFTTKNTSQLKRH